MEKEEKLIKNYLEKASGSKLNKTKECPDNQTLLAYIRNNLDKEKRKTIEKHLANCNYCLSQISIAQEALDKFGRKGFERVPKNIINKTKHSLGIDKKQTKFGRKSIKRLFFLIATIIFFILSFLIPKYFLQFLIGALILGIRWSFESENGKTLIMVLDSWRKHSQDKDDQISNRLKDQFKK